MSAALTLGGLALAGGLAATSDLIGDFGSFYSNKRLQELDHEFQSNEARAAREWQSHEAQLARDWQTRANRLAMDHATAERIAAQEYNKEMSNTAIRRQMADYSAAGLNPILAAAHLGASSPTSAATSGVANSPSGAGGGSTARGSSARANIDFNALSDFVGQYLKSARDVSAKADEYEHDRQMQEARQRHELDKQHAEHAFQSKRDQDFERRYNERNASFNDRLNNVRNYHEGYVAGKNAR